MATDSKSSTSASKATKPGKPFKDYPLFPHASGHWAKKIKGKMHYFGPWGSRINGKVVPLPDAGWKAAKELYDAQKDDLHAGRTPRQSKGATSIKDLCNRFLTHCQRRVASGEMVQRTWDDYKKTTDRIVRVLGLNTSLEVLGPDDFQSLRDDISKTNGVVSTGNEITRAKVIFNFAFKDGLIENPVRYGLQFTKPSKKTRMQAKHANGKKLFSATECRMLLDGCKSPELRAMVLLALNCGFGNSDCAKLPVHALDLDHGWIDFPRPKTGVERRCKLWPETIAALKVVLERRFQGRERVFITERGQHFDKEPTSISQNFGKLLADAGQKRKLRGFYALRHTFRTVADGCLDQVAVNSTMGHTDSSMAGNYRQQISDERLEKVAATVHVWLFTEGQSNAK